MDNLEPITRNEMFLNGDDLEPITREEMILAGADLEPLTRHEWFLKKYRGSGDVTIERLAVTENGTYSESGKAYSPVVVNVPAPPIPENAYLLNDLSDLPANIASFTDGTDLPMASLKVAVTPYQDLSHGDPSPSNICPIIGWDEAVVTRCGKNFANAKYGSKIPSVISGQMVSGTGWSTGYIKVDNSKTYSASVGNDSTSYLLYYDYNLNFLGSKQFSVYTRVDMYSYFSEASYIKLRNDATENNNPHIQLELGDTATTYSPYNGATYTIDLNGTRYGGTLDATDGTFLDMIDHIASYNGEELPPAWISDRDVYAVGTTPTIGAEVVYPRATPITVQLSPTQVKSLEGVNNINANCGQITEVKYFKKA